MGNVAQDAELGRRVKALRALRGWSQAALARRAHVDRRTISRLERGAGVLPMTIRTVGRLLGVRFDDEPTEGQDAPPFLNDVAASDTAAANGADPEHAALWGLGASLSAPESRQPEQSDANGPEAA